MQAREGETSAEPSAPSDAESTTEEIGLVAAPESPTAVESTESAPGERLEAEVGYLKAELDRMQDLVRRKQAEFENFRKRSQRERQDFVTYAAAELVKDLLPVLDNLERALASEPGPDDRFREGIEIIYRQFRDILARSGVKEVEAEGRPFDPYVHEAVSRIESAAHNDGTVIEVLQKGFFLKDKLLRPALVSVAQEPSDKGSSPDSQEEMSSEDGETVPSDAPSS